MDVNDTRTPIDRSAAATALAKTIAYRQCGKHADADAWLARLIAMLERV